MLTDGAFRGGKVILYLHGNDEDIFESRESLRPFMPPSCNLALVAYTGYGLSFGSPWERGCYDSAHRLYDWVHGELGYKPEDSRFSLVRDTAIFSQDLAGSASRKLSPASLGFNTPDEVAAFSQMFEALRDQGIVV